MTSFGVIVTEDGVSTTSKRERLSSLDGDDLFPGLSSNVKGVDIVERDSSVVKSTVSSIDDNLTFVVAGSGVSTWRRSTDKGFFVLFSLLVSSSTRPDAFLGVEEPSIVKTHSRAGVSSENEHTVITWRNCNCDVLSTGKGDFVTLGLKLFPDPVLTGHSELIHIGDRLHFLTLSGLSDTSVHEVAALANEVHRVTRARAGLFPTLLLLLPF